MRPKAHTRRFLLLLHFAPHASRQRLMRVVGLWRRKFGRVQSFDQLGAAGPREKPWSVHRACQGVKNVSTIMMMNRTPTTRLWIAPSQAARAALPSGMSSWREFPVRGNDFHRRLNDAIGGAAGSEGGRCDAAACRWLGARAPRGGWRSRGAAEPRILLGLGCLLNVLSECWRCKRLGARGAPSSCCVTTAKCDVLRRTLLWELSSCDPLTHPRARRMQGEL